MPDKELIQKAIKARENARAPYSKFPVGAALEATDGSIWTGVNVESSSYGLTVCAERIAIFKALSEGIDTFSKMAIVAVGSTIVMPCGACRQIIADYAPDIDLILYNPDTGEEKKLPFSEIYPYPFTDASLPGEQG